MGSLNKVILIGRITKDPELRRSSGDVPYVRTTVACDRMGKDDQADFIGVMIWRQSAEYLAKYGTKGNLISVEGSIRTGSYTDRDGKKVYTTDVYADRVQILEKKSGSGSSYPNEGTPLRKDDIDANDGFDLPDNTTNNVGSWEPPF